MNAGISKKRQKHIQKIADKHANSGAEKKGFKNSSYLATIYASIVGIAALLAMLITFTYAGIDKNYNYALFTGIVLIFTGILSTRYLLITYKPEIIKRNSRILLICLVSILAVALFSLWLITFSTNTFIPKLFIKSAVQTDLVALNFPYLVAPALITLMLGVKAGISTGLGLTLLTMIFGFNGSNANTDICAHTQLLVAGTLGSTILPFILRNAYRRTHILKAFITTQLIQAIAVAIIVFSGYNSISSESLWMSLAYVFIFSFISVLISFMLTIAFLPIFEHIFACTSNVRLNEFCDLRHPLLLRLSSEAEGTFHHSIQVATLAANAAERIGANSFIARVGGYFHDIGKLSKPYFFVENTSIAQSASVHDNISPSMSALVIMSHVKDGVALAHHYNMPQPIIDIIRQHHGTTTIAYFLNKARKLAEKNAAAGLPKESIDESLYRYPGPSPISKEAGIVMLADSIEAASRSLDKPTPAKLDALVRSIINQKILDGQLDNCELTNRDIAIIKTVFSISLTNSLHARIPYPSAEDAENAKEETPAPAEQISDFDKTPVITETSTSSEDKI